MSIVRRSWFIVPLLITACASAQKSSPETGAYHGHGAGSVSAETIAQYAAPALDPEMSRKIQLMLDLRAPGGGMLSADGKHLYFTWSVTGTLQVWRLDGPQTFPVQMTGGEDHTRIVGVIPNGKWIVVSRDRNGEENPGIYLQPAMGGELQAIQHLPGVQTSLQHVGADSRYLYIRANDIKSDSYAIYRYEIATHKKELVYSGEGAWWVSDVDEKNGKLLLSKAVSNVASEHFELDLKSKRLKPVIGQDEVEDMGWRSPPSPASTSWSRRSSGSSSGSTGCARASSIRSLPRYPMTSPTFRPTCRAGESSIT